MVEVVITIGISASGKTTWAEEQVNRNPNSTRIVCRDDIRKNILNEKGKVFSWDNWNWKWEATVNSRFWKQIDEYLNDFSIHRIIIADTNLNRDRRREMFNKIIEMSNGSAYMVFKFFPITWEEAVKRDNARANGVGLNILARQYEQWINECTEKPNKYIGASYLPKAWIIDLDGTLAKMGNRSPYEWHKVGVDTLNESVAELVRSLHLNNNKIIILSGRDEECRDITVEWLFNHKIPYIRLIMRKKNDTRKDSIIKEEFFWKKVAPFWNVLGVVEDRPVVARKWRELGLNVFQVSNPYIEF
jgi:predicted kinase